MKTEKSIKYKEVRSFQQRLDFRYGKGVYKAIVILCLATLVMTSTGCGESANNGSSNTPTSGVNTPTPTTPNQPQTPNPNVSATGTSTCSTGAQTGGDVVLKKIKFETDYDVCSDIVKNFSDDKNFWVLKDGGDYYHWLRDRHKDDKNKPSEIPITFESGKKIKFEATFEVVKDMPSDPVIRVEASESAFTFTKIGGSISKAKGDNYKLTFESNKPFENTVKYFEYFSLTFFNEADNDALVGRSCNRLYMTYGEPLHNMFSGAKGDPPKRGAPAPPLEESTLKVRYSANSNKKNILESLLYIGCKYADGKSKEDDIVDEIFNYIKNLNVNRSRITGSMGYWRNTSTLHTFGMAYRNGRVLLQSADARCGEWAHFFINLCAIHSIRGLSQFNITYSTGRAHPTKVGFIYALFLVKTWNINDPKAPTDNGGQAQGSNARADKPLNMFWDHVFVKYKNRYYDSSYGIKSTKSFGSNKDLLNDYASNALTGVVYVKSDASGEQIHDVHHSGLHLDPLNPGGPDKYIYHVEKTFMADHLTYS